MSHQTGSHVASSTSASSRGDSSGSHASSYSAPSTSTVPTSLASSTEKRSVSFKEPPHSQRYHHDFEDDDTENYSESDSDVSSKDLGPNPHRGHRSISSRSNFWTTASTQDAMIHLEFDCNEDIESYLEELSRLKRLGRFNDARRYFDYCRTYCGDHPDLIVDYVDTLLAQGAFKDVLDLAKKEDHPILAEDCGQIYHHYLHSALCIARAITLGWLEESVLEWRTAKSEMVSELQRDFTKLSSFQIKFLCHFIHLETTYDTVTYSKNRSPGFESIWESSWDELYTHLLCKNQVWDMRDIFHHILYAWGAKKLIKIIFGTEMGLNDSIDKFVSQWAQDGDESTDLAILDVLTTIALEEISLRNYLDTLSKQSINRCMDHARDIATSIRDKYPTCIKSSPYLRWILAEVRLAGLSGESREPSPWSYLDTSSGSLTFFGHLPIYLPLGAENPGWSITPRPGQSNELLKLGLNTARDLGDYELEVFYLQELVHRSGVPQVYLPDLITLEKNVIGDKSGHLASCLAKYLLATEQESQRDLLNELSEIDRQETSTVVQGDPILKWQQRKIQLALCSSLGESKEQEDIFSWMEKSAYYQIPSHRRDYFQQFRSASSYQNYYLGENSITKYAGKDRSPRTNNSRTTEPSVETYSSFHLNNPPNHEPRPLFSNSRSNQTFLPKDRKYFTRRRSPSPDRYRRSFDTRAQESTASSILRSRESPTRLERRGPPSPKAANRTRELRYDDTRASVAIGTPEPFYGIRPSNYQPSPLSHEQIIFFNQEPRQRSPIRHPSDNLNETRRAELESSSGSSSQFDKSKKTRDSKDIYDRSSKERRKHHNSSQPGIVDEPEPNSGSEYLSKATKKESNVHEEATESRSDPDQLLKVTEKDFQAHDTASDEKSWRIRTALHIAAAYSGRPTPSIQEYAYLGPSLLPLRYQEFIHRPAEEVLDTIRILVELGECDPMSESPVTVECRESLESPDHHCRGPTPLDIYNGPPEAYSYLLEQDTFVVSVDAPQKTPIMEYQLNMSLPYTNKLAEITAKKDKAFNKSLASKDGFPDYPFALHKILLKVLSACIFVPSKDDIDAAVSMASLLLEGGFDVHSTDENEMTPFAHLFAGLDLCDWPSDAQNIAKVVMIWFRLLRKANYGLQQYLVQESNLHPPDEVFEYPSRSIDAKYIRLL
ncbi:hypothetical protein NHQ30_000413 [Ciborinia camelliae]|nr:hypothetical protein NHQ30_000413 [Ciborinia camelliae]